MVQDSTKSPIEVDTLLAYQKAAPSLKGFRELSGHAKCEHATNNLKLQKKKEERMLRFVFVAIAIGLWNLVLALGYLILSF
jgi:hypothetical protein